MSYKTNFREIEMPKNADELRALGTDANSMRSLGAATYRNISQLHTEEQMRIITDAFLHSHDQVVVPYLTQEGKTTQIPHERKAHMYTIEGMQRAAKRAGHSGNAEYIAQALERLKQ
ncbi:MAG TPA: hypothetical protein VJI12_01705 [archaeon]|nr:hypothetical protein [archaeon]